MTISSATSTYSPPSQVQARDVARTNKDSGDIAKARQQRDNTAEQKAVAELRKDTRAPERDADNDAARVRETQRENAQERSKVGSSLDVKA